MLGSSSFGYAVRLAELWAAWLLVMLFHVELGLMPLLYGLLFEIKSEVATSRLPRLFLAMLFYVLVSVGALLVAVHAIVDAAETWAR